MKVLGKNLGLIFKSLDMLVHLFVYILFKIYIWILRNL